MEGTGTGQRSWMALDHACKPRSDRMILIHILAIICLAFSCDVDHSQELHLLFAAGQTGCASTTGIASSASSEVIRMGLLIVLLVRTLLRVGGQATTDGSSSTQLPALCTRFVMRININMIKTPHAAAKPTRSTIKHVDTRLHRPHAKCTQLSLRQHPPA